MAMKKKKAILVIVGGLFLLAIVARNSCYGNDKRKSVGCNEN